MINVLPLETSWELCLFVSIAAFDDVGINDGRTDKRTLLGFLTIWPRIKREFMSDWQSALEISKKRINCKLYHITLHNYFLNVLDFFCPDCSITCALACDPSVFAWVFGRCINTWRRAWGLEAKLRLLATRTLGALILLVLCCWLGCWYCTLEMSAKKIQRNYFLNIQKS